VENPDKIIEKMEELMNYERTFSLFQSVKVLHHFGITYEDITNKIKCDKYKEKTNVLAYYILKSIGIYFLNAFIEWTIDNNSGSLDFTKTQENINKLFEFIKEKYNSVEYLRTIEIFENWFSKEGNKTAQMEMETMRMSISE
jgi:hypothetical protein